MHSVKSLPSGYAEILKLDLQKNKRDAIIVNVLAAVLALICVVAMHFFVPVTQIFRSRDQNDAGAYFIKLAVLIAAYVLYIILHELTHAAVMRFFGAKKVRFGFTGMYAYAGSEEDYFDRFSYRLVAAAPLVVWGIVFLVLQCAVPVTWFWVIGMLQIGNVSGAAGDIYVIWRVSHLRDTILVRDTGLEMTIYDQEETVV